jgi:hypothetical protein
VLGEPAQAQRAVRFGIGGNETAKLQFR